MLEFVSTLPIYLILISFILSFLQVSLVKYISYYANFDGARVAMALQNTEEMGENRVKATINAVPALSGFININSIDCTKGTEDTKCTSSVDVKYVLDLFDLAKNVTAEVVLPTEKANGD